MAVVLADRVQETATASTTAYFALTGAVTGFQSFAVVGSSNLTYYSSFDASGNWEVGLGSYSSSPNRLYRTFIYSSSNGGSAVSTFSGTVTVFLTYPSGRSVNRDDSGDVTNAGNITGTNVAASNGLFVNSTTISSNYTVASGTNASSIGPVTVANGISVTVTSGQRWVVF